MMVGPMKRKIISTGIIAFLVPTVVFVGIFAIYSNVKNKEIAELQVKAETVGRYIAAKDMPIGHIVTTEDLEFAEVKGISSPVNSFSSLNGLVGEKLKVPVFDGTILTESMLYNIDDEITNDVRNKEFNMISLPSDLLKGDYVDIRIAFPTGEDYIVTAGKEITKIGTTHDSNSISMNLTEEDIVRLSSAVIESYMSDAVKIYAVKYPNWYEQLYDEETVDYITMYKELIATLIEESETVEIIEIEQPKVPMLDENGEPLRDENGELLYEEQESKFEEFVITKKEEDFTSEEIASYMKLDVEDVNAIRTAISANDEALLALYSQKSLITETPVVENYPVKKEVAALIASNPNILEELKVKYDIASLEAERMNIETMVSVDPYDPDSAESAKEAIASKLTAEITAQKTERSEYLQSLIRAGMTDINADK